MQKSFMSHRSSKIRHYKTQGAAGPELENHFILRLLEPQAKILREDVRNGQTNIKDRLSIQLDHTQDKDDMRNGIITFDTIMYKSRLYDFPTIMETYKTIDGKNFYKTADVCQMIMVREGEDDPTEEEETKKRRRDQSKVEKKYLWPHGYTPSLKNVRKRRFRKTLRKKVSNLETLDLPDIEKEVKRLLRTDNEAIAVKWEVIRESDSNPNASANGAEVKNTVLPSQTGQDSNLDKQNMLFGVLSSSEEEIDDINIEVDEDDSRLSVDDSRSMSVAMPTATKLLATPDDALITQFTPSMFSSDSPIKEGSPASVTASPNTPKRKKTVKIKSLEGMTDPNMVNNLYTRLSTLDSELTRLLSQRAAHEAETLTIQNAALRQKFSFKLADIQSQIDEKEQEVREIRSQLNL